MEEFRQDVIEKVIDLKPDWDEDVIDYVANDLIDRALIYTNREELPDLLVRPFVSATIRAYDTFLASNEQGVTSARDGEQSVSYDGIQSYMASKLDTDVFVGLVKLLEGLRKANTNFEEDEDEDT